MKPIIYRASKKGDENKIIDLFLQGDHHLRTKSYWNWINRLSPFGKSFIEVAVLEESIIGHYGIVPVTLSIGDLKINCGFATQAIIHTSHRNLEIIHQLTERMWKRCEESQLDFIYGFPNDNIWKIKQSIMDWKSIGDFKSFEVSIDKLLKKIKPVKSIKIKRLYSFGKEFDFLIKKSKIYNKISISKNSDYLNWRIFSHPLNHYIVLSSMYQNELTGYMVLKLFRKNNMLYGHIIDFHSLEDQFEETISSLLSEAIIFFKWANVSKVSLWLFPENDYQKLFSSFGFEYSGFNTHFGYRNINNSFNEINNINNWHLSMADSDAF